MSHPSSATVYGIPHCDTVKKARDWLSAAGVGYEFHDFKKAGVPDPALADWLQALGWRLAVGRNGRDQDAADQPRCWTAQLGTIWRIQSFGCRWRLGCFFL